MPYLRYAVGGVLFFLILFMVVRPLMAMLVASEPISAAAETPALPYLRRPGGSGHQRNNRLRSWTWPRTILRIPR